MTRRKMTRSTTTRREMTSRTMTRISQQTEETP
jgi:hypothetical protein